MFSASHYQGFIRHYEMLGDGRDPNAITRQGYRASGKTTNRDDTREHRREIGRIRIGTDGTYSRQTLVTAYGRL